MGKYTLFWVLFCMAFSIFVTYMETRARTEDMEAATRTALYRGLHSGCDELVNPTRDAVRQAISDLELLAIESGSPAGDPPVTQNGQTGWDIARESVYPINCELYARHRTNTYYQAPGE